MPRPCRHLNHGRMRYLMRPCVFFSWSHLGGAKKLYWGAATAAAGHFKHPLWLRVSRVSHDKCWFSVPIDYIFTFIHFIHFWQIYIASARQLKCNLIGKWRFNIFRLATLEFKWMIELETRYGKLSTFTETACCSSRGARAALQTQREVGSCCYLVGRQSSQRKAQYIL